MATDARTDRRRKSAACEETRDRTGTPKTGRRRRLWIGLALLVLLVWLTPPIVARTPLVNWAMNKYGGLNGTAQIESLSLSWFSPVSADGITVKDSHGKTVASVASVSGERSLAAILCDYTNLGRYHVRSPKLSLVLREDGSNIEDLLANYLASSKKKTPSSAQTANFAVGLDVVEGGITVVDELNGQSWQVDKLAASFDLPKDAAGPMAVQTSVAVTGFNPPARLTLALKWASSGGEATLQIDQFPLAVLRPLASRLVSRGTTLAGRLCSDIRASWDGKDGKSGVLARASLDGFALAMPQLLGTDTVRLDRAETAAQASWRENRFDIEKATVQCDVLSASLQGTIPTGQKEGFSLAMLIRQRHELTGQLDLARLARMLPATFHLKQNMRIESGRVGVTLASQPAVGSQGVKWHGQLEMTPLVATAGQGQISWPQPVTAVLDAHDTPQGAVIDNVRCQSDFLDIRGAGTPDDFAATLGLNLGQLADRLGQFLDLDGVRLAGQGSGAINWRRVQQQFGAGGQFRLDGFQCLLKGKPAWREDSITASLTANGQTIGDKTHIDAASLSILSGTDRVGANLISPVTDVRNGPWAVHASVEGQLRNWPARVGVWLAPNSVRRAEGAYNLQMDASVSTAGCTVRELKISATPLAVDSVWATIDEPQVVATMAGQYDSSSKAIELKSIQFISSTLTAGAAGGIASNGTRSEGNLRGQINYDLARLCNVLRPQIGSAVQLTGRGSSEVWYGGPLAASDALAAGAGEAGLRWDAADVGGIALGRGELRGAMRGGAIQIMPLELTINQGRVHLSPRIKLRPDPMELTLPAGPLAERVQIDPAMCKSMLKFAAPAVGDVSSARGTFSVYLDRCRIPLSAPKKCDVAGRLHIHTMEIASGAMLKELSAVLGRTAPAKLKQEADIKFRVENGRVYHDSMELQFPDLTIRTSGWVGFDKSLNVVAEMPVPPKWLAGNANVSQALRNQTIRLPIKNTVDKPQIDRQEMQRANQQIMRQAAGSLINEGINKGIDQLFKPRK
ncbi:MAG: hypothetical protein ABFC63_08120 [Thermoguttaceae bacterium]